MLVYDSYKHDDSATGAYRTVNDVFFVTRQPVAIVVFIVGFVPSNVKCIKVTVAVICG